jgi:hypothetical protein
VMHFSLQNMTEMFSFWTYFNIMQNMKHYFEGYTNPRSPRWINPWGLMFIFIFSLSVTIGKYSFVVCPFDVWSQSLCHFSHHDYGYGTRKHKAILAPIQNTRPTCSCGTKDQTVDHLLYECELLNKERDRLISTVLQTDVWPICKKTLIRKHFKIFVKFTNEIPFDKLNEVSNPLPQTSLANIIRCNN